MFFIQHMLSHLLNLFCTYFFYFFEDHPQRINFIVKQVAFSKTFLDLNKTTICVFNQTITDGCGILSFVARGEIYIL